MGVVDVDTQFHVVLDQREIAAFGRGIHLFPVAPRHTASLKSEHENALTIIVTLGGSTNAVLHLLAIANEAGVALDLEDFNRIAAKVPHIADMKPGGKFHMTDLDRIGGVPVVLKMLLDAGLLHGDVMTVTGKTMAENLAEINPPDPDGVVVHPLSEPINVEGGLLILTGSLAPKGSVVKVAGLTPEQRLFISWATIWRSKMRDEAIKNQVKTDPHSPGMYRAYVPLLNLDTFHQAFGIKPGDGMYLAPEKRVKIW